MGAEMTRAIARRSGLALVLLGLTACSSSESASSTVASTASPVSVAPPTTTPVPTTIATPPTTVSSSTTAAPTTAVATTTAATTAAPASTVGQAETAKAEIVETLESFNADYDACLRDTEVCDLTALLDTYVAPDEGVIRPFLTNGWQFYDSEGLVSVNEGRIERSVASVEVAEDDESGFTHLCEVTRAFDAPRSDTTVTEDPEVPPIFAQYFYEWTKQADGRWLITYAEFGFGPDPTVMANGGITSLSEEELATCFS